MLSIRAIEKAPQESYEAPKVFSPLPGEPVEPCGHAHAHLKYVADADYDTSPT
ncbi:MAG: hypothetical protein QW491_11375 [Thermoproteota archaeon]|nr:hypothetical protein [Candidatus Brockarchaeota archaeon]